MNFPVRRPVRGTMLLGTATKVNLHHSAPESMFHRIYNNYL